MNHYDLCVIGGGPAGFAAAMHALDFGKRVLLIEKKKIGGAGIYDGALASKTFWEISREALQARKRAFKYGSPYSGIPFEQVLQEVNEAVEERSDYLENHLLAVSRHRNHANFELVFGTGRMEDATIIEITNKEGKSTRVKADYTVLATGSRPRMLPHIPVDEKIIITSDGVTSLTDYPESIVILGAGIIGCEYTTVFSNFGRSKVDLVSNTNRILPFEDQDISNVVERIFQSNGVHIHRNAELVEILVRDGRVHYQLCFEKNLCEWFSAEKALISVGRVPNLENLGVYELGIKLTSRGFIDDIDTQTNIPNIYAVGDLTADVALVNVGELEGRHAVEKIFAGSAKELARNNISTIMFLNPETASVGINEQDAQKQGIPYRVVCLEYKSIARAVAMRNTKGFFKILVTDDEKMLVLGMRALGEHASSAIQAVALLMAGQRGIEELAEMIHPHPSITEGVQEAMRVLLGNPIIRPLGTDDCCVRAGVWRDGKYSPINGSYFSEYQTPSFND
ncbi:MAG: NAD(P)/FAD-dependent oxidoreductase [Bacteroidota bacterium]